VIPQNNSFYVAILNNTLKFHKLLTFNKMKRIIYKTTTILKFSYFAVVFAMLYFTSFKANAQDDLDNILDDIDKKDKKAKVEYTTAAFKASRLIQLQTPEMLAPKTLEFRIAHRFGAMNKGVDDLFGLDKVSARFGFEYGLTRWLTLGVGRSGSYLRSYDMSAKFQLLRQSSGGRTMPISLLYYANMAIRTDEFNTPSLYTTSHRLFYAQQFIITRKFSDKLSLLLAPTWIHKNLITLATDKNDIYALGVGGRYKISNRVSFNFEYIYRLPDESTNYKANFNTLSLGFDLETGGHVFQLHFTNASYMIEQGFVADTNGSWGNGDIRFGFNLTRQFSLGKKQKKVKEGEKKTW
jgi:opacity protein-like surface antigen